MAIKVVITKNDGTKPDRLLAEAEVHFLEGHGPFTGLKLVGFQVWTSAKTGGTYVTLPARAFGSGEERRYFDYLRSISGEHRETDRVKELIREAWHAERDRKES